MIDVAAFIEARLDEDEERATRVQAVLDAGWNYFDEIPTQLIDPARVLRDVAAKRAIVARYEHVLAERKAHRGDPALAGGLLALLGALKDLASAWSEHPDYDAAWAPRSADAPAARRLTWSYHRSRVELPPRERDTR